jgi:hypothetical protein
MTIANWLTFMASVIALLAVILSYRTNKKQLQNANELALNQIRAAATETSRRLKAEILLKEKQAWIREFRETINELLFLGDPFLDGSSASLSTAARVEQMTRLAHKVDLMLPVGTTHAALAEKIVQFADLLADGSLVPMSKGQRLSLASQITILTREILRNELASVEANL